MPAWARLLALAAAVPVAALLALLLGPRSPDEIRALAEVAGAGAPFALLAAWLVLVPLLFSGSVLAAASGLVLGTEAGVGVAVVGAMLGAGVSFLVARHVAGDAARRLAGPRARLVEERLVRRPILAVAALRAAPGMPASVLAYAAGLTRVRLRHFLCGMALGGSPRVIAYVALGGSLTDLGSPTATVGLAALAIATIAGGVIAWRSRDIILPSS